MLAACPNLSPTSAMEAHCDGCAGTHLVHSKSSAPVCFLQDLISLSPLGSPGHLCTPPLQQKNMRSTRSTPTHGTHKEPCTSPVPNHIHGDPTIHNIHGDPRDSWYKALHPWGPHKPMAQCTTSMGTPQTHGTVHHIHEDPKPTQCTKSMGTPNPWHNTPHPRGPQTHGTPHPRGPQTHTTHRSYGDPKPTQHGHPQTHSTTHHIHGHPGAPTPHRPPPPPTAPRHPLRSPITALFVAYS